MNGPLQSSLRRVTHATRPLALRRAGKAGAPTSVVRHVGRNSGRAYETPVVAVAHDDSFLIALPYGELTDWMKNVLSAGKATIVTDGESYDVDQPRIIPMSEATQFFRTKEQQLHRRFGVESCMQVHRLS